jgi:GT2 family glycosyltransferase
MTERAFETTIDVVIPTFGGWELTESCLRHLARQTARHSVIVADNGSPDGTPERIRDRFPDVRLLEMGENLGFAVACNRGVEAGSGDVVVLLNNDVDCRPDFLQRLVAPLKDPRVGSVASLLLFPGQERIYSYGLAVDSTLAVFARQMGSPVSEATLGQPRLMGPDGAAAAYRRSAWTEAGGLDERIFAYYEELDLGLRLRSLGWETAAAGQAIAVHHRSGTFGRRSAWQRYNGGFSRGYLLRRYGVLRRKTALRALTTEVLVVLGDAAISRDGSALRGRVAGWRAARGLSCHPRPPAEAIDTGITFRESMRLRRTAYAG